MITGYLSQALCGDIAAMVAAVPGMSAAYYLSLVHASVTGAAAHLDFSQVPRNVQELVRLAENTIYGSSRVGVQRYGAGSLLNTYYIAGSDEPPAPPPALQGLSRAVLWYSLGLSSRIGSSNEATFATMDVEEDTMSRVVGLRHYEMTDHLGNVLATVLDRKTGAGGDGVGTLYDHWHADVSNATDYYPFGMQMPGRVKSMDDSIGYKFGFNGQLKDNEIAGTGNYLNFGARLYDARLAHFPTRDPKAAQFPWQSPYVFADNNPISLLDENGEGAMKASLS